MTITLNRQPTRPVHLEVELDGNTVSLNPSVVSVSAQSKPTQTGYVIQDRTTFISYALQVADGVFSIATIAQSPNSEPIVQDNLIPSLFWRIFVSDGILSIEGTTINQDDVVCLFDTVTSNHVYLVVSDGIIGIVDDTTVHENFYFAQNDVQRGIQLFGYISGITVTGLTNGFIGIKAFDVLGQPINQNVVVNTNMPARFFTQNGRIKMKKEGQSESGNWMMMAEPDADIRENDVIEIISGAVGLTAGRIVWKEAIYDFAGITHHLEAEIASY